MIVIDWMNGKCLKVRSDGSKRSKIFFYWDWSQKNYSSYTAKVTIKNHTEYLWLLLNFQVTVQTEYVYFRRNQCLLLPNKTKLLTKLNFYFVKHIASFT